MMLHTGGIVTRTMRYAAYLFALLGVVFTMRFAAAAGDQGLVIAVLGGTLAVMPYVVVKAIEAWMTESAHH